MKKNILKLCPVLLVWLLAFTSCSDMEEIHEEYLDGETIYAGKLDSLKVRSGYKRVKIIGSKRFLGNSKQALVTWEDQEKIFEIPENTNDEFEFIIEGLEERSYEFKVRTLDANENSSITQSVTGKAIGDIFVSSQSSRRVVNFENRDDGMYVNWADKAESEYVVYTEIAYETTNDEIVLDTIFPEQNATKLTGWLPLGNLEVNSFIISGNKGIDTLALDSDLKRLPEPPFSKLNSDYLSLVRMPSDNPGTSYGADPVQYLFDGDGSWSGNDAFGYHSGENAVPHHFTIDLGVQAKVRKVRLDLRDPNNFAGNNPTEVEFWGINNLEGAETSSSDTTEFQNAGWKLLHSGAVDGANNQSVEVNIEGAESYRYIRYRVTNTVGGQGAQLTEMTFWGEDIQPVQLEKNLISMVNMPSDNPGTFYGADPVQYLFDGDGSWSGNDAFGYHSGENAVPHHFTIDLGVSAILQKLKLDLRDPNNFAGNNPTEIELWGRNDLEGAETTASDAAEFEANGWELMFRGPVDGANNQSVEVNIDDASSFRYIRYRVTNTVGGQGAQLTEMTFWGVNITPIE